MLCHQNAYILKLAPLRGDVKQLNVDEVHSLILPADVLFDNNNYHVERMAKYIIYKGKKCFEQILENSWEM